MSKRRKSGIKGEEVCKLSDIIKFNGKELMIKRIFYYLSLDKNVLKRLRLRLATK